MTAIEQRRVSIERMAQMWRYVTGRGPAGDLTMGDFVDLSFDVETFEAFLDRNRDVVQVYEEVAV